MLIFVKDVIEILGLIIDETQYIVYHVYCIMKKKEKAIAVKQSDFTRIQNSGYF